MIKKIKHYLTNIAIGVFRIFFGVDRRRVLFLCFGGKFYADNTRAVSEALYRLNPSLKLVWLFNNPNSKKNIIPDYIKAVKNSTLAYLFNIATSGCIVSNYGLPYFCKSKNQLLVQVWHGDKGFKKILYDANPNRTGIVSESIEGFCDLAVAGSEYGKMQFTSAFRYKGEILMKGTPRNDALINFDEKKALNIKKNLGVSTNKKICLYAPTLRDYRIGEQEKQDIDLEKTLDALNKKSNEEWVCLVRLHPAMSKLTGVDYNEHVINVSGIEDMADLLLVSDLLITDYSSSAGDFALLHRPIILYQSDREEYLKNTRKFYFDIDESPFYVAKNQAELEELIENISDKDVYKNCEDILKFYGNCETGKASEYVAERICAWVDKK